MVRLWIFCLDWLNDASNFLKKFYLCSHWFNPKYSALIGSILKVVVDQMPYKFFLDERQLHQQKLCGVDLDAKLSNSTTKSIWSSLIFE